MPNLTLTEAAKYVSVDRSTLYRHAKDGTLTTTTDARDRRVVDTAELDRVYGMKNKGPQPEQFKQGSGPQSDTPQQLTTTDQSEVVALLKDQLSDAKTRETQWIAERGKLLRMLETEQRKSQQLMLSPPPDEKSPKRGFWHIFRLI